MKNFCMLFLVSLFISSSFPVIAVEPQLVTPLWRTIYEADWSLGHKRILCLPHTSIDDMLVSGLLLSYLYHRMGDQEKKEEMFKSIDDFLSHSYG